MLKKLLFISLMLILTSCKSVSGKFTFSASILGSASVTKNSTFDVLVVTSNSSGSNFYYEGSSTVVGAIIYLKNESGHIIRPLDVPVTKDYRKMVFENNDSIKRIWTFNLNNDECGSYDLYFEFFDDVEKLEDFIYVKE